MDLRTYLKTRGIHHSAMAERVGVTSQALYRYMSGDRLPRRDIMERIAAATDGVVQPNDFFKSPAPAEAA